MPQISPFAVPLSLHPQDRPHDDKSRPRVGSFYEERARGAICDDWTSRATGSGPIRPGVLGSTRRCVVRACGRCPVVDAGGDGWPRRRRLKTWVEHGCARRSARRGGGAEAIRRPWALFLPAAQQPARRRGCITCLRPGHRCRRHRLRDGTEISVLRDWNGSAHGARLRQMCKAERHDDLSTHTVLARMPRPPSRPFPFRHGPVNRPGRMPLAQSSARREGLLVPGTGRVGQAQCPAGANRSGFRQFLAMAE